MWKRRLAFNLIFFICTLLAGVGWISELRGWAVHLGILALIGHSVQIVGAFGNMLTPDEREKFEEEKKDFEDTQL